MFSPSDYDFMTNKMKIIVGSIESKLNEPLFVDFRSIAIKAISTYIELIKDFEASGAKRNLLSNNEAENSIREYHCNLVESINNNEIKCVLDALRHSFTCYADNGLHQLYTRQENECWHPKIILTEVLTPNDIDSLDDVLTLYRGCNISELDNGLFGQAWTTSLEIAKAFAYDNYSDQEWFDIDNRLILETEYSREDVLFSHQSVEYEVVVKTDKLGCVRKHREQIQALPFSKAP